MCCFSQESFKHLLRSISRSPHGCAKNDFMVSVLPLVTGSVFLCSKHSLKNLAMTLGSCRVKKEDSVGTGPKICL